MMRGKVLKLIQSHGSRWGRIEPAGSVGAIFFNEASLSEGVEFTELHEGQAVEFDEEPDRVNGTHAVRIVLAEVAEVRAD
jgi:cold shock CspA family protein